MKVTLEAWTVSRGKFSRTFGMAVNNRVFAITFGKHANQKRLVNVYARKCPVTVVIDKSLKR